MKTVTDPTGQTIIVPARPMRIVSLVPSLTELLFDLGLNEEVVGITKFCVHPEEWFRAKTRVGGTKRVAIDRVKGLAPDLVIANKEENRLEDVQAISTFCPVYTTDVGSVEAALGMIRDLSALCGLDSKGEGLEREIRESLGMLSPLQLKAAYLIWKDPWMTVGGDTFIHDMMAAAGIRNVFNEKTRYPQLSLADIAESGAELIMLSSEPYPFKIKHMQELSEILPEAKIVLVDGEIFSWYGSRMRYFKPYIEQLFPSL